MMKNLYQFRLAAISLLWLNLVLLAAPALADPAQVQKLIADGQLDKALSMTQAELAKDKTNVSYRFLKGLILARQEKLEQARDVFIDITRTNPELPEPYNNLAVVYASMGDFDQAREALEQAINTHPSYATAHENIGDIYARLASQAYNQALELDRENNAAKAKLSLVNELFSLPQAAAQPPVALAGNDHDNGPVAEQPPAPVQEVSTPPPAVVRVQAPEERKPAVQVRDQGMPVAAVQSSEQATVAAVKQTVIDWSEAWSARDINAYLTYYAANFSPPDDRPLEQWRELRRMRLSQAGSIKVTIADLVVEMADTANAKATFTQSYQSEVYSDRVKKTLVLRLENNRWLITREQT